MQIIKICKTMKIKNSLILFIAALLTFSCQNSGQRDKDRTGDDTTSMAPGTSVESRSQNDQRAISIKMEPASGSNLSGNITFTEANGEVTMKATIRGLESKGVHAIHIHEKGDCSAEDATSAGGHWNPTNEKHGKWGDAEGYHAGDIGNLEPDENGVAELEFKTDQWCIGCNDISKDIVGKAIIIHEDPDDFETQPTGNAGGRIGCGVIK